MSNILMNGVLILVTASVTSAFDVLRRRADSQARHSESLLELKIAAFDALYLTVEVAGGRWWHVSQLPRGSKECDAVMERAEEATHEAWYATRRFDLFFPSLREQTELLRQQLLDRKAEAQRQSESTHDPDAMKALGTRALLDVIRDDVSKVLRLG